MTDRALTSGMASALVNLRPIFFYEGEFTGGILRLCTEIYTVSWNGQDWIGGGRLISISKISESTEIKAAGFEITLDHCTPQIVAAALAQCRQGQRGTVWAGGWDASHVIVPDPYLAYEGRLDVPEILLDGVGGQVKVSYESRLIDLERAREVRITHQDLQSRYPGDRFREYIPGLQDKVIPF